MLKIKAFLRRLNIFGKSQETPSSPPPATPSPNPDDDQIQQAMMRLYEDEALTDALTDKAAQSLLKWAEQQLKHLAAQTSGQSDFDTQADRLRQLLRAINRTAGRRADLSTAEMSEQLARVVRYAREFAASGREDAADHIIEDQPTLNHLAEQQADLSETELVDQIIQFVEQTIMSSSS